jgi:hypothetical protein
LEILDNDYFVNWRNVIFWVYAPYKILYILKAHLNLMYL